MKPKKEKKEISDLIEEILGEFDERFWSASDYVEAGSEGKLQIGSNDELKSFLQKSLKQVAERVAEGMEVEEKDFIGKKNKYGKLLAIGFNLARQDQLNKAKNLGIKIKANNPPFK